MNHKKGFTLLELVMTMAIVGIVAAITAPNFASYQNGFRLKTCAIEIHNTLQMARLAAVKEKQRIVVEFANPNAEYDGKYIVCIDKDSNNACTTAGIAETDDAYEILKEMDYPEKVKLADGAADTIRFNTRGLATTSGTVSVVGDNVGSNRQKNIIVNVTGLSRITETTN